jgi:uncharacterized protein (TIGR02391 family)
MPPIPPFPEGLIEGIARILGDCGTGSDISRVLAACGLEDNSNESTKWRRLYWVFMQSQQDFGVATHILAFTQSFLIPARFVGRSDEFEARRLELNVHLAFAGLEYGQDGRFHQRTAARTLDEAEARVRTLRTKFQGRCIHPEVLKYCRAELLQDNYFHAVFEAVKGLAQRIREVSGIDLDGVDLVDAVFSVKQPVLALNTLQTESERSEHKGFANLMRGCFTAVRNPLAHEPKILWQGEDDAADYLTLISLLHRKLDDCVPTHRRQP